MQTIIDLLKIAIERQASDLHIIAGYYPTLRINGELFPIRTVDMVTEEMSEKLLLPILHPKQKEIFLNTKEMDFGYEAEGCRFRVNFYYQRNGIAATFRLLPTKIKTVEELGLPSILHQFTKFRQGLILFTGPTGEGKSTSMASLINEINQTETRHIVTIEDPIEYMYPTGKSIISQRELYKDTETWSAALKAVLREDPDVILVGEMRDLETIQATLTLAETGHLVFSSLHTSSAPETINRIIDAFPSTQQGQVKAQLSTSLKATVAQRLLPHSDGTKLVAALEILINTSAVSATIREGKIFMLDNIVETGEQQGMIFFEKYLLHLVQTGQITKETAYEYAFRPVEIRKLVM